MKYLLFTGITGRLGKPLSERLRQEKVPVACIIRKPPDSYDVDLGAFKALKADITDRDALFEYVSELRGKVEMVVHMATVGMSASKEDLRATILNGTMNLYEFASAIECPKFVFLSSIAASGPKMPGRAPVDERVRPREKRLGDFGKAKLETERRLLTAARSGATKVVILRLGNVYGPPTKLSFIKPVVELLRERNRVFYHRAKDSVMWAPVYIQDVIDCILSLAGRERFDNQVYFVTGPDTVKLRELAALISPFIGVSPERMKPNAYEKVHLSLRRTVDRMRVMLGRPSFPDFIYSNEKIRKDLGFFPKTTIAEGIKKTLQWAISSGKV